MIQNGCTRQLRFARVLLCLRACGRGRFHHSEPKRRFSLGSFDLLGKLLLKLNFPRVSIGN